MLPNAQSISLLSNAVHCPLLSSKFMLRLIIGCLVLATSVAKSSRADCALSIWGAWSDCSQSCGGGVQKRHRSVVRMQEGGGKPCSKTIRKRRKCNTQPCEQSCDATKESCADRGGEDKRSDSGDEGRGQAKGSAADRQDSEPMPDAQSKNQTFVDPNTKSKSASKDKEANPSAKEQKDGDADSGPKVLLELMPSLTHTTADGTKQSKQVPLRVVEGQDAAEAAFSFVFQHSLPPAEASTICTQLRQHLINQGYAPGGAPVLRLLVSRAAHRKRASRHMRAGRAAAAAADLIRALAESPPDLGKESEDGGVVAGWKAASENDRNQLLQLLGGAITEARAEAARERAEQARVSAAAEREKAAAQHAAAVERERLRARELAIKRKEADRQAWRELAQSTARAAAAEVGSDGEGSTSGEVVASISMTLTQTINGTQTKQQEVHALLHEGADPAAASVAFCRKYELPPTEVLKIAGLLAREADRVHYDAPLKRLDEQGYWARVHERRANGQFAGAAADATRLVQQLDRASKNDKSMSAQSKDDANLGKDAEKELQEWKEKKKARKAARKARKKQRQSAMVLLGKLLSVMRSWDAADAGFIAGNFDDAASALERLEREQAALGVIESSGPLNRNTTLMLVRALTFGQLSPPRWAVAVAECSKVLRIATLRGEWQPNQPRTLAVAVGTRASLELGDTDQALKYLRLALRHDPDHKRFKDEYRQLKNLKKSLSAADAALAKKRAHDSLKHVESALATLDGLSVDTNVFRSSVLLKKCTALSELRRHEDAVSACNFAVDMRGEAVAGVLRNPSKMAEALMARARAKMADNDFDAAVRDMHEASEQAQSLGPGEQQNEVQMLLQEAKRRAHEWKNRRDHAAVLELPVNLHEVSHQSRCAWLKKQYKRMAKQWHPDKVRGCPKRAARKMSEIADAKAELTKQWGCKRSGRM